MTGLRWVLATSFVALLVCALAIGAYDSLVRQPRTPRLAVVDIAKLFAAAERMAKDGVLAEAARSSGESGASATARAEMAGLRVAESFGPRVQAVLADLAGECRCAIVVMAAVIGGSSTVPDYTQEAAQRLGVVLRTAERGRP